MKVGTKSVLFGAHQFLIHPLFVLWAWYRLFGFPWDPRLWFAFVLHDIGYLGKPNMDGPEGERHVELGAVLMMRLFGMAWADFCLYHSRFFAARHGKPVSQLCLADKLAIVLTPSWAFLSLARLSGEIHEYRRLAMTGKYVGMQGPGISAVDWHKSVNEYLEGWICGQDKFTLKPQRKVA